MDVPIVLQPRVIMWYPTAIITCPCQEGKLNLIISTGWNNPSACGECGRMFLLTGVSPHPIDPNGLPQINVQIVMPTAKGEVH